MAGAPDPSKVRVYGPGVEHGVLAMYQSRFICDTRGAGAGQLTVRIRGPKGNEILSKIPPKCRLSKVTFFSPLFRRIPSGNAERISKGSNNFVQI